MAQHRDINHTGLTGVSTVSYASNANQTSTANYGGAATTVSRGDHIHLSTGGISSGTSFPAQPAFGNNIPFWRTDLGLMAYYDGTRWVSTTLYTVAFSDFTLISVDTDIVGAPTWSGAYDLYLYTFYWQVQTAGTHDGTKYWTLNLRKVNDATYANIVSPTTSALAASGWQSSSTAINALLGTTQDSFSLYCVKTGAPGDIRAIGLVTYRLVLT